MDTIIAGSSTNSRRSLSRARSTTTRISSSPISDQSNMHRGKRFKSVSSPEFSRSATEVSSTTPVTDMSLVRDENTLSDYDKALSLLKNNPPEQRLDIHMPYCQYLKLEECWSNIKLARGISEDQKYPYLAYNSCAEYVTVVTAARSVHERAAVNLTRRIFDKAQEYLSSHGADASLSSNICEGGSPTRKGIYGNYIRGKKQADGTIMFTREGDMEEVMIAVEVGYSEHYTALCRDKDMWIEGQHVKEHVGDVRSEMKTMAQSFAEKVKKDSSQGCYGYIEYRGHKWFGDLNEAFIEVWRASKRQPTRYQLIQNTWSCNRLPKTIGLKMSDFIPDDAWKAANIVDGSISFDGDSYVQVLRKSMKSTAEERYLDYIWP
ncbi:hypothetical protein V1504DRAFT_494362 [Lipomyces starkeyi]